MFVSLVGGHRADNKHNYEGSNRHCLCVCTVSWGKRKSMSKLTIFVVLAAIIAVCSDLARAELDIPASGTYDIVIDPPGTVGISFYPIPYTGSSVYLFPFASDDGSYTPPYSDYNLAEGRFSGGSLILADINEQEGDLGIRVDNISGATQTFEPSVLTLDFVDDSFNVYLPGFTFDNWKSLFFWVAQSGATYYANFSKDVGFPELSATYVMGTGDEYLARTPEPTTAMLFGLGALLFRRRRKAASNY